MPVGGYSVTGNRLGYGYDYENRLVWAAGAGGSLNQYGYAPDNRRVLRESTVSSTVTTDLDFWLGDQRIARFAVQASGALQISEERLFYSGGLPVKGDRVGTVMGSRRFLPYGEELTTTPSDANKFATYYRDAATGLDYADQRFYGSGGARFLTADPYVASGGAGSPASWNRYSYVEGDPVNFNDPSGELAQAVEGGGGGGGLAAIFGTLFRIFGFGRGSGSLNPALEAWKANPGSQVVAWDRRIAEEAEKGEEQDRRYIKALKVIGDCYQTATLGGAAVRVFTYQPIDQHGGAFVRGEVTVSEQIFVTSGGSVNAGAPWTPDKQNADGSFTDYVSKFSNGNKDIVMYQTFSATMLNSAGFAPGVPRPVMVYYPGYGSEYFGTWGHWALNKDVRTNNYSFHPINGRTTCGDPTYP